MRRAFFLFQGEAFPCRGEVQREEIAITNTNADGAIFSAGGFRGPTLLQSALPCRTMETALKALNVSIESKA
jgi:hypothetical protein